MPFHLKKRFPWACWLLYAFILVFSAAAPVWAAPFSTIYFLGDSLSDTGNVSTLLFGLYPSAPYYQGRFSDGPLFTEVLASNLGHPEAATPLFRGGNNYAIGGASTGISGTVPFTGILFQSLLLTYNHNSRLDPNALYVVYGGGNDVLDAVQLPNAAVRAGTISLAALNMQLAVKNLAHAGAKNFLVPNLPNLGAIPRSLRAEVSAKATAASISFNRQLLSRMNRLERVLSLNIADLDVFSLVNTIQQDALTNGGTTYGITAPFSSCAGTINCSSSLFFDDLHPTSAAHAILGNAATQVVLQAQGQTLTLSRAFVQADAEAVPEPGTFVLLSSGIGVFVLARRMKCQ